MKGYKNSFIVILLFILISVIIYSINVTNNFKVEIGSQVKRETDIALGFISTDMIDIIDNNDEITEEHFGLIRGELRTAKFLHMMPLELQRYVLDLEKEFIEYKKLYLSSADKNSNELRRLKQELLEMCYKGKELHHILSKYRDKDDYNKTYKMWYKIYKNDNHELRKLMVGMLDE